jgi:magnesium transporter
LPLRDDDAARLCPEEKMRGAALTMHRHHRRRKRPAPTHAPGTAPGTITIDPQAPPSAVHVFAYGPDGLDERAVTDLETLSDLRGRWPVLWVNVTGLGDAAVLERLGKVFGLHRLALEDIAHTAQRPKVEAYENGYFIVARMLDVNPECDNKQFSLFFAPGVVVTFEEGPDDCFNPVRDRIRQTRGRIRQFGADYLVYALLDTIIDRYFPVMDELEDRLDQLEEDIEAQPMKRANTRIYQLKQEAMAVRRVVSPLKEAIYQLLSEDHPLIVDETRTHLRDCVDHAAEIIDRIEMFRESALSLMDVYLSSLTGRLDEIMTVLTIIATIFIPLSFIAGVYGMNFDRASPYNLPELGWRYGYLFSLALMAAVTGGLLYYFWRRGWIGKGPKKKAVEQDSPRKE